VSANILAAQARWRRTERLHGTAWLMWRQSRWLMLVAAVAVLALGAVLGYSAYCLRSVSGDACGSGRTGVSVISVSCDHYIRAELAHTNDYLTYVQRGLTLLPLLVGMFVGAPLLTREYERRTQLLAWTQSVSPVRWLAVRLGWTAAVVTLGAAGLNALSDWFWRDYVLPGHIVIGVPYATTTYASIGVMPVVYSLYALALGLAVGLLLRSTLVSVLVAGTLTGLTEFALHQLSPYLYPAVGVVQAATASTGWLVTPANAWVLSSGVILRNGSRVPNGVGCDAVRCADVRAYYGSYQPVSHFWPIQGVESAIVLALTAALTLFAFGRLRRGR
jgi:hypothetical protein